jgi:hypothetical protein
MKFLEHHPIADHVLDIVRHHGKHIGGELGLKALVPHGRERSFGGRRSVGPDRLEFIHEERISEIVRPAWRAIEPDALI